MKKILIIGIVASGKTTLAKRLSKKINVPWYELDSIVHHQTSTLLFKMVPSRSLM
ncbi:EutP/PduV family microcompartment system protein, partial [Paenibacillus sp. Soil787]|uniref:EutP/PduV family microcompartment system protein n=1 Tax=Paenibacillus sp. Soil787 TaxID=1736411 RepID=UPI00138F0DBD